MQQYQIYQERKPRFKAMRFNGIADIEALRDMSYAVAFDFAVDQKGVAKLTLLLDPALGEKSTVQINAGEYVVIAENGTPEVLRVKDFQHRYEPAQAHATIWGAPQQPMASPMPAAPSFPAPYIPR